MTFPGAQQGQWGQPYGAPLPPKPPRKSGAAWLVVALVAVIGLLGGTVLLVASRDGVAGVAIAAEPTSLPTTTSLTPTTTAKKPPAQGARLSYTDYDGNWDYKMGSVELRATWVEGRDHTTCAPIEKDGKLSSLGCQYAAEMVLTAENGTVKLTQFILSMPDAASAKTAAEKITDADLKLRPGTTIDKFETGKWRAGDSSTYVVITLATGAPGVAVPVVEKYLKHRHVDIVSAILFR
ncbi:hypothetical protein [Nocardia camponoti]|uniref:Uncharacterized protein n=1 Tax=Nocardia camponoti TaxID=1616106 RepID=A0A917VBY6_9NOCA|nr:hypothetical protein [Nocardia camponoti]GGK61124.1 hypothetical protein GCM10011591_36820 [Nocardia camponoti]